MTGWYGGIPTRVQAHVEIVKGARFRPLELDPSICHILVASVIPERQGLWRSASPIARIKCNRLDEAIAYDCHARRLR